MLFRFHSPLLRRRPLARACALLCALIAATTTATAAPTATATDAAVRQPFTVRDLVRLNRLAQPSASPDGRYVAYVLRQTDIAANQGHSALWIVAVAAGGAPPRRLTWSAANDTSPLWGPDSRTIYFLSDRSGRSQVWRLSLEGGEAIQVTDYLLEVDSFRLSPAGDRLALSMQVFPDCADLGCTKQRLAQRAEDKASGRIYDRLFVRHWTEWSDGRRAHLFTALLGPDGTAGAPVELARGQDADAPSRPFGGREEYAFSPDGGRVVWTARIAGRTEPWSTNFDLFSAPADGSGAPQNLTADNPAWDARPVFLRNGDLAYTAMDRPGFESDRFHIVIRDAASGAKRTIAADWDRSVSNLAATADGRSLIATADDLGQVSLFRIDVASGKVTRLIGQGQVADFTIAGNDVVVALASLGTPADLHVLRASGGPPRRLTEVNAELLRTRALSEYEQFSFPGAGEETVRGYVMKPYGYVAGRKFPVAFVVHGGPQVAFGNDWSFRWNPQAIAGAGFAVVFIDFHGTPGYGQKFTDSISGDWGGKPLVDLQKGLAAAIARYDWLDGEHVCSLGASYGGFMQNWIEGNWPDRFRCIVNHAGVFDARAMYYSTEELWFEEWEFHAPYFEDPTNYERFNPVNFVARWHTPMLVVTGALDFRIPDVQGLSTFTALQRRGIDSRLLYFPDEGHWIQKPSNSVLWYDTVLDWLDHYLRH